MRLSEEKKKRTQNIVMIVDDDTQTRQALRKILAPTCRVLDASDTAILANMYQQYLPHVVYIDAATSRRGGQDAVKEILEYDPDAFIVILSREHTQEAILESKERGAKGFILKPFQSETVVKYLSLAGARIVTTKKVSS